jgi:hypothetical protein
MKVKTDVKAGVCAACAPYRNVRSECEAAYGVGSPKCAMYQNMRDACVAATPGCA